MLTANELAKLTTEKLEQATLDDLAHNIVVPPEVVRELVRRLETYREMATGFADILAASASDLLWKKSTGKNERGRQANIVLQAHSDLKHETCTQAIRRERDAVIKRLADIIDRERPLKPGHSHGADMRCCEPCPAYATPRAR